MKLSEAIRLGAMMAPQAFNGYLDTDARCALAGACDVLGIKAHFLGAADGSIVNYARLESQYPWLGKGMHQCPACSESTYPMALVYHLNDHHRWTREEIAAVVEQIENQQAIAAQPDLTVTVSLQE